MPEDPVRDARGLPGTVVASVVHGRGWWDEFFADHVCPPQNVHFYGHSVDVDSELARLDSDGYQAPRTPAPVVAIEGQSPAPRSASSRAAGVPRSMSSKRPVHHPAHQAQGPHVEQSPAAQLTARRTCPLVLDSQVLPHRFSHIVPLTP